ncbi:MAG: phosphoribosylformylglycinamidine cyclo-ligase [Actinobacteria bacterium]|nr:phosphoribosylformylglycinamidine cyclo-ligase [Actinomycetota bacterium]
MTDYRRAGVDLAGAERHVKAIGAAVTSTWGAEVVGGFGGFAAGIRIPPAYRDPILMLTTDGVGTKLELARQANRWDGVGSDLVAMVVDDLAAVGARPVAVVDYMAVGRLHPERDKAIVESIAAACQEAEAALLGGETAEHPGVMEPDQVDLAATALGVVEDGAALSADRVRIGDVIVGLRSPNLRSNGFSLVRSIVAGRDLDQEVGAHSLAEVLLAPSVIYSPAVQVALAKCEIHAAVHVTGGGMPANLPRSLPAGSSYELSRWEVPPIFGLLAQWGEISDDVMAAAFNLGIGFCLICPPSEADTVVDLAGHEAQVIGKVTG